MIQSAALLKDLKAQLKLVQADLRSRADDQADRWGARLQEEYAEARKRERTGYSWVVWRDNEVDQAAVAWLIAMTFVRFCEDNDLLSGARINGQPVAVGWIAGPGDRTVRAEENLTAYFRENPTHNRRDWLRQAFRVLAAQPAGKALVDEQHNPVWTADISAERAAAVIDFWRRADGSGHLVHDFSDPDLDTRFLGDLYQDLSDHARKTYALLQTPVFVEEFILDQTLTPALAELGLEGFKLIDPTCGSGHFLLGAFQRLVSQWEAEAPALDLNERVRRAMNSIHGVDLNPFAVAIARFRLTVAGLQAMGQRSLVGVPSLGFHLAIGDSLLGEFGGAPEALQFEGEEAETYFYDGEDLKEYAGILKPGSYHVVVGNPPYITVKDKALNALYRLSYETAAGKYALSAPFMELFFRLAIRGEQGRAAGFVGQITANSFMKREFGKKLIEYLFAGHDLGNPVDLTRVIDTSGAYIPGHGTPTVILVGRRRRPVGDTVRAALGVRGEPGQPADPSSGLVWTEIVDHISDPGFDGKYVSIADVDRGSLSSHPWSLTGGGASAVLEALDAARRSTPATGAYRIGVFGIMGADEAFMVPAGLPARIGAESAYRPLVVGEQVRDFSVAAADPTFFPYDARHELLPIDLYPPVARRLWCLRTELGNRATFSKRTYFAEGRPWYEWHQLPKDSGAHGWAITYASISTHNHFVLDRGGRVFKQSSPIIKLPADATEDQHLELLGVLNSSVVCFWLKQVSQSKSGSGIGRGIQDEEWEARYDFAGTKVEQVPLPSKLPRERGRRLDALATSLRSAAPAASIARWVLDPAESLSDVLKVAATEWEVLRDRLVFEQEELDWETYRSYGLVDEDLTYGGDNLNRLVLGQRAFELALARRAASGNDDTSWFARHGSTPITEIPESWPTAYCARVQQRLDLMVSDPNIGLLERPEFKRRWSGSGWDDQLKRALRSSILDRLEQSDLWRDEQGPTTRSVTELADELRDDDVLVELVSVYARTSEPDLAMALSSLMRDEAVPYLAAHRYKAAGMEKFRIWQDVWAAQRREDAGEHPAALVPPKFNSGDFQQSTYWSSRGKLDVPKERFILYPDLGREGDSSLVLGWAGWDHKDQALALAREFPLQDALGAGDDLLTQMVAGLVELEPWLHQWHSEMDASFGVSPAQAISGVIDQQLGRLEATREEVTAWEPPAPTRGRRAKKS